MYSAHLTFHCTFTTNAILPPWKGSTFRGGFGWALRRAVCVTRGNECAICLLAGRCLYALTFEADLRKSGDHTRTPPLPYVIEPPIDSRTRYEAGEPFQFSLILLGETVSMFPYFVYAFELMGEKGLGKRINDVRARFQIDRVSQNGVTLYQGGGKELKPAEPVLLSVGELPSEGWGRITVTFLTPLRIKRNNQLSAQLPFEDFVRGVLRRISTTFSAFGVGEPPLDYRGLVFAARSVKTIHSTLRWDDPERYSNRQKEKMFMGGLLGDVVYEGNILPYLPLIQLGSSLHIGKQTTFGHGLYRYQMEMV